MIDGWIVQLAVKWMIISVHCRISENGDPDQERGVHAPVSVPGLARQRHLLDCIRPHQVRPLHHRKSSKIFSCLYCSLYDI